MARRVGFLGFFSDERHRAPADERRSAARARDGAPGRGRGRGERYVTRITPSRATAGRTARRTRRGASVLCVSDLCVRE